jgi:hypothetical protein
MKKLLCTALVLSLGTAVFVNCQKDGVYNPKQKISKIRQAYNGEKRLIEAWTWEGNLLSRTVEYSNDTTVKGKVYYFYEKKQLVRMEYTGFSYCIITYSGSQYDKIDFYTRFDRKTDTYVFTYDKKKVSKIMITTYADPQKLIGSMGNNDLKAVFIPKMILEQTDKMVAKSTIRKANEDVVITHTITYDKDNPKEWRISQTVNEKLGELVYTYDSYDENNNPYYASNLVYGVGNSFQKNNPTKVTCIAYLDGVSGVPSITDYTYQYDTKKYPTEMIEMRKEGTAVFPDTLYYEYK